MNFTTINNQTGTQEGYCIIKTVEKKRSVKGDDFLDMTLADKSGEINAKKWDYSEQLDGVFEANTIVKVRGKTSEYRGTPQFVIDRIRAITENDDVDMSALVATADCNVGDMYNELYSLASSFKDEELKKLVTSIYEERKESLLCWPAAFRLHHALKGGLLYHTLSIVRLAQSAVKIYPYVDEDLLLAGAMLHDIAKIDEFDVSEQTGIANGYSLDGDLIGHLVRGAIYVDAKAKELGISEKTAMLIEHMLISHHGVPEFGCAKMPMFIEAELLSMLDTLDAKMYEMAESVGKVQPGEFTAKLWALDNRKLFNHGRSEVSPTAKLF